MHVLNVVGKIFILYQDNINQKLSKMLFITSKNLLFLLVYLSVFIDQIKLSSREVLEITLKIQELAYKKDKSQKNPVNKFSN